jgi:hypothetical protein
MSVTKRRLIEDTTLERSDLRLDAVLHDQQGASTSNDLSEAGSDAVDLTKWAPHWHQTGNAAAEAAYVVSRKNCRQSHDDGDEDIREPEKISLNRSIHRKDDDILFIVSRGGGFQVSLSPIKRMPFSGLVLVSDHHHHSHTVVRW